MPRREGGRRPGGFRRGMWGFAGARYDYGWKYPGPVPPVPGGKIDTPTGGNIIDEISNAVVDNYCNRVVIKHNTGSKLKGIILGSRLGMMGPMHSSLFVSRIKSVDVLLKEKRITAEQAKYRKLKAAFKYNSYLMDVSYLTPDDFVREMEKFANSIGAVGEDLYIYKQVMAENGIDISDDQPEKGRSK